MSRATPFKEASFIEGRLLRITKRKVEIESEEGDEEGASILTLRLAENVTIDLDTIGEEVKAVIVDGKVAKITPLAVNPEPARPKSSVQLASPQVDRQ